MNKTKVANMSISFKWLDLGVQRQLRRYVKSIGITDVHYKRVHLLYMYLPDLGVYQQPIFREPVGKMVSQEIAIFCTTSLTVTFEVQQ